MPADLLAHAMRDAAVLVAARPPVGPADLDLAKKLKAVIAVSGGFPDTIDYEACFSRGIILLSCAPGFRQSVAEMVLTMALAGAGGLVREHEAFRRAKKHG